MAILELAISRRHGHVMVVLATHALSGPAPTVVVFCIRDGVSISVRLYIQILRKPALSAHLYHIITNALPPRRNVILPAAAQQNDEGTNEPWLGQRSTHGWAVLTEGIIGIDIDIPPLSQKARHLHSLPK